MHKEGLLCQNVTAEGIRDYDTVCMKNKMGRIGMKYIRLLIIFSNKKSSLLSYQLISSFGQNNFCSTVREIYCGRLQVQAGTQNA